MIEDPNEEEGSKTRIAIWIARLFLALFVLFSGAFLFHARETNLVVFISLWLLAFVLALFAVRSFPKIICSAFPVVSGFGLILHAQLWGSADVVDVALLAFVSFTPCLALWAARITRKRFAIPAASLVALATVPVTMAGFTHLPPMQRQSIAITTHDGVKLAADIYHPRTPNSQRPAVLNQTRYNRSWKVRWPWQFLVSGDPPLAVPMAQAGFTYVAVDARGSGASEGAQPVSFAPEEIADGPALVAWIREQPWSNGKVFVEGISYSGISADLALGAQRSVPDAGVVAFAPYDVIHDTVWPGGLLADAFAKNWSLVTTSLDAGKPERVFKTLARFVSGARPLDAPGSDAALDDLILKRKNYIPYDIFAVVPFRGDQVAGDDIWRRANFTKAIGNIKPERLVLGGWYDGGNVNAAFRRALHDPETRLIVGPWDHGGRQAISPCGDDGAEILDYAGVTREFFEKQAGLAANKEKGSRYRFFIMCGDGWRESEHWPPRTTQIKTLYLADDRLIASLPDPGKVSYRVNRKASTGLNSRWLSPANFEAMPIGYPDIAKQADIRLKFETPPLERGMTITGNILLDLYLTANAADAAIYGYVEDVGPDGDVRYITEGQLRATHAVLADNGDALYSDIIPHRTLRRNKAIKLSPDKPRLIRFGLQAIGYHVRPGRRLRLSLAGSDADNFAQLKGAASEWLVHVGGETPSAVSLPVTSNPPMKKVSN